MAYTNSCTKVRKIFNIKDIPNKYSQIPVFTYLHKQSGVTFFVITLFVITFFVINLDNSNNRLYFQYPIYAY